MTIFNAEDKVSFLRPGVFGHCQSSTPALFMDDKGEATCVMSYKPVTQETCEQMDVQRVAAI